MQGAQINASIRGAIERLAVGPTMFLLAVSGGPDSQCLLKAFPHVAVPMGHSCVAVGVDHGLRASASSELDLAERLASSVEVEFRRIRLQVQPGPNLMCRARDARYAALAAAAGAMGASFVTTAHHADDRAETVLIRLVRGEGIGSLGVMPELSGRIFRPLLSVTREDIVGRCRRLGVPYAEDPSNADPRFLRSRVRHELLPLLRELNPSIRERLLSISDEAMGR